MVVKLREVIDKQHISIYALSKTTGIAMSTLSRLCNNKTQRIDFDTLDKLCETLNCQTNDILIHKKD